MADPSPNPQPFARRHLSAEYRLYFAAIFLIALPIALAQWAAGLPRHAGGPSVLARALGDARVITPTIFSA